MPGLEVLTISCRYEVEEEKYIPDYDAWTNVPNLNFYQSNRQVKLNANHESNRNSNYAVPQFRERLN